MFAARLIAVTFLMGIERMDAEMLTRGPYLQSGSSTGIVIRWRTDLPANSVIRYGTNALSHTNVNLKLTTEHEIRIGTLDPDIVYQYSVGTTDAVLVAGPDYTFKTAPTNARPVRVWVIGDSGTADTNAAAVRDSFASWSAGTPTDVWLMLGDNAYPSGTDSEYQVAVFDMYRSLLRHVPLWPSLGNHDVTLDPLVVAPYEEIFTLPQNGESGGLPSGTERYYSFDYANVHFVCLDSYTSSRSSTGPMATWLRSDLAATEKDWIIAYCHHPPYSWGEHDSDWEIPLIEMREQIVPLLEEFGVDVVLSGHSHSYERSYFLDGHYSYSWELDPTTSLLATSGVFEKAWGGMGARAGTVYVVCGNSGANESNPIRQHPAMAVTEIGNGSMVLDIDGARLTARYLRRNSTVGDMFTIDKSAPSSRPPVLSISRSIDGTHTLAWPTSRPTYAVEGSTNVSPAEWRTFPPPAIRGRSNVLTIPASAAQQFFRLRQAQ